MATASATAQLTRVRKRSPYNDAEQHFSRTLQQRLNEVLEGKRNSLALLRKYPTDPGRIGVLSISDEAKIVDLRLSIVEAMVWEAVQFICADSVGGPIVQEP